MKNNSQQNIAIIGSGMAGSFLALMLASRGHKVTMYEQLSKADICDSNSKRSYNITLYKYGVDMLKKANLWKGLQPYLIPLKYSSTQLAKDANPIISPVDHKKMQYYSLARGGLLEVLMQKAETNPLITVYYEKTLLSIDRYNKTFVVQDNKTRKIKNVHCDVIFGTDGVNSVVRSWLQQGKQSSHTQEYAEWSYKQFIISAEWVKKLQYRSDTAYTWSRKDACITSFPNKNGSLAALLVLPLGEKGFAAIKSEDDLKKLFEKEFPVLLPLLHDIYEQIHGNPEGSFVTVHTNPWYYKGFMALVGDAAHGFYPFFGQGTSAAFGDSMQLIKLIDTYGPDWKKIFPLYQNARKSHMDMLGEVSKIGFQKYLRSKRADKATIYDAVETIMHQLFPKLIKAPLYYNVLSDPDHTASHVKNHKIQRMRERFLGVSLAVTALTGGVLLHETLSRTVKSLKHLSDFSV